MCKYILNIVLSDMWMFLSKLVRGYNHVFYQSIQCSPASLNSDSEIIVSETLFGKRKRSKRIHRTLKVGDFVRHTHTNAHLINDICPIERKNYFNFPMWSIIRLPKPIKKWISMEKPSVVFSTPKSVNLLKEGKIRKKRTHS